MKSSVFIKVALIDQMQQIADLGLWFHLSRLIPSGVEVLARVANPGNRMVDEGEIFLPTRIEDIVADTYKAYFPGKYALEGYPTETGFFSIRPMVFLCDADKDMHFEKDETGRVFIHVPTWFSNFTNACYLVLIDIEAGKIKDIEVLKTIDE